MLRDLIHKTVGKYRDVDVYSKVLDQETKYKKVLSNIERNWKKIKSK